MHNVKMESVKQAVAAGIGAPVRRVEDRRFLTGKGHYVDDIAAPNMAFAYVVRSPHAHAKIIGIDKSRALETPGVIDVITGPDLVNEKIGELPGGFPELPEGARYFRPSRPILATEFVRHVGDCVALIVAETLNRAKDAGELLSVDYEVLPAVTLVDGLSANAPRVWQNAPSNVGFQLERGDCRAVEQVFANAAHIAKLSLHYPRVTAVTMEPRSVVAYQDHSDGRYTLFSSTQMPHQLREYVSDILRIPELNLRVISPDVGGGFGMKCQVYPEEVLVLFAARKLERPVKWTGERSDVISSDTHGRHQITEAELALSSDGRILGLRSSVAIDIGAYLSTTAGSPPKNALMSYSSTYLVPVIRVVVQGVFTNTAMMAAYRGTAKPEGNYVIERLIDKAAREMEIDPIEMRRRNLIPSSAMPHETASGFVYDSGEFEKVLDKAIALSDWAGFTKRRAESERRGLRRGIGLAMHCQRAGNQSERMEIRVGQTGTVALHVGTHSHGQGHETVFAQMANEWLGVNIDQVRVFQGNTDNVLFGRGTFAQRSLIAGGSALQAAAAEVIKKGKRLAGFILEASDEDIDFEKGTFRVKGTDRVVSLQEVARKSYQGMGLPPEFGVGLDGAGSHAGPFTFPNGCMVCEVEVDTDTGRVELVRLSAIDDVGTVVNPLTLEGQMHGSTAQGIGEALLEQIVYETGSGQLITGSLVDYAIPHADNVPPFVYGSHCVPSKTNPLGVKGGSETGNVAAPAAIINAIVDALAPFKITNLPLPATPERIWQAIRSSRMPQT
jgi:aerobic carbon-monoxide dehydrogenase large subunit